MDLSCTTPKYNKIYAPWLANPGKLLDLAEYKVGDTLLDLAGGTGAISEEALRRIHQERAILRFDEGLSLLDMNPRTKHNSIKVSKGYVENVDNIYIKDSFNIVVCRQAVGYIYMDQAIPGIWKVLKSGGRFVFNSFGKPSRTRFRYHKTKNGVRFAEFSLRIEDHVFHIQARLNQRPGIDFSWFKYWSAKELHDLLMPWFKVDIFQKHNSFNWVCTKRDLGLPARRKT